MLGNLQFSMLVAGFLLGTAVILLPVPGESKQNMWIVALAGWFTGLAYVSLLGSSRNVQGRHFIARIIFSLYILHLAALVTRNLGEILNLTLLTQTPQPLLNSIMVLLAAYAAYQGIENIVRLAAPFVLTSFLFGILLIILAVPVMHPDHLLPVFESDWKVLLSGTISFASFPFMETVVFLPLLQLAGSPRKSLLYGTLVGGTFLFLTVLTIILVLPPGRIIAMNSPTFVTINSIPGEVFIKALVVILWIQTGFLKLSVLHYALSHQLSQALKIDCRAIILPLSVLIINFSILVYGNILEMFFFASRIYPYYAIPLQLAIPLYFIIMGRMMAQSEPVKAK